MPLFYYISVKMNILFHREDCGRIFFRNIRSNCDSVWY